MCTTETFSAPNLFDIRRCRHLLIVDTLFEVSIVLSFAVAGPKKMEARKVERKKEKPLTKSKDIFIYECKRGKNNKSIKLYGSRNDDWKQFYSNAGKIEFQANP